MINIPDIFKNASLGNLSSSAGGIKMTVYYLDGMKIIAIERQYCEENVLDKEKKRVWFEGAWSEVTRVAP